VNGSNVYKTDAEGKWRSETIHVTADNETLIVPQQRAKLLELYGA
jgi:hypothetical protein